jgi:hypothetical protein
MVVFTEGGDPCLLDREICCLKPVRPGDKVFLSPVVWGLYTSQWNAKYNCDRKKSTLSVGAFEPRNKRPP